MRVGAAAAARRRHHVIAWLVLPPCLHHPVLQQLSAHMNSYPPTEWWTGRVTNQFILAQSAAGLLLRGTLEK